MQQRALLAIDTVLRALVDHASATDPLVRNRILSSVDASLLIVLMKEPHFSGSRTGYSAERSEALLQPTALMR